MHAIIDDHAVLNNVLTWFTLAPESALPAPLPPESAQTRSPAICIPASTARSAAAQYSAHGVPTWVTGARGHPSAPRSAGMPQGQPAGVGGVAADRSERQPVLYYRSSALYHAH
jgi:hypothetical protein